MSCCEIRDINAQSSMALGERSVVGMQVQELTQQRPAPARENTLCSASEKAIAEESCYMNRDPSQLGGRVRKVKTEGVAVLRDTIHISMLYPSLLCRVGRTKVVQARTSFHIKQSMYDPTYMYPNYSVYLSGLNYIPKLSCI